MAALGKQSPAEYLSIPIGSMYAIYGNIYHQYTPHVSIYTIRTTVKTRVMEDMYSLDIGCHKMQKTEVSDVTFPNSDTPI